MSPFSRVMNLRPRCLSFLRFRERTVRIVARGTGPDVPRASRRRRRGKARWPWWRGAPVVRQGRVQEGIGRVSETLPRETRAEPRSSAWSSWQRAFCRALGTPRRARRGWKLARDRRRVSPARSAPWRRRKRRWRWRPSCVRGLGRRGSVQLRMCQHPSSDKLSIPRGRVVWGN